jgi:hypothetical protein
MSPDNKNIIRFSFNIFYTRQLHSIHLRNTNTKKLCRSPLQKYFVTQLHCFEVLKTVDARKSQNFEWWTRFNFLCIMRHVCVLAPFWTTPTRTPFSARSAELPFDHTPEHRLTETPWRAHTDRRTNQTTSANSGVRPDAQCPDVSFKTTRKARRYE